ncbi:MAG: tRNA dihydrouridine synthase [Phycisphaerales bacterium]
MLRIGSVQLQSHVLLAPVAGHCDLPFRLAARSCGGVGLAFTDLLCPHGVLKQNRQTRWLMATCDDDQPLGMQLYGCEPDLMCEAARWAVDRGAKVIDINMGCPVDKVTKTFAGSMMLCTPGHTVRLAERLVNEMATYAPHVPVTAKLRLGYHDGEPPEWTAPALAKQLVRVGIRCITIHGRTAAMRFKGTVNLDGIRAVINAVHEEGNGQVPGVGNGDIRTPFDAARMVAATGCDGVMIARAALGAPWLLRDTAHLLATGVLPAEYTLRQRLGCLQAHFGHLVNFRDERYAINRIKQKIGGYSPHLGPCKTLKQAIRLMTGAARFAEIIARFLDEAGERADEVPVSWSQRDAIFRATSPAAQRL